MNQDINAGSNGEGDNANDDEEEPRMNFMSASQVKPEHIEKLDKAVRQRSAFQRYRQQSYPFFLPKVPEAEEGPACGSGGMDPHQLSEAECARGRPR